MTLPRKLQFGVRAILGAAFLMVGCEGGGDDDVGTGGKGGGGTGGVLDTGGSGGSSSAAGETGSRAGSGGSASSSSAGSSSASSSAGTSSSSTASGGISTGSTGTTGKTGGAGGSSSTVSNTGGTSSTSSKTGGTGGGTTGGSTGGATSTGGTGGTGAATVALREGRFDLTDPTKPQYGWSGAALVARFQGTGAVARIDGSPNQYTVVIDGNVSSTILKVVSGTSQYTVASGLAAGTHDIVIARRTEGNQGPSRFSGLDITGGQLLAPPAAPDRRIELFGDSISAGYGLDGKGPNCSFTADTENHYLTYAAIAARNLKAELHTNAWSGIGMYRNYGQTDASPDNMPAIYARTIPDRNKADWNFASWVPHVVVINLGTNDSNKGDPGEPFRKTYLEFVRTLHQKYPDAAFVLTIGPMLGGTELTAISNHLQYVIDTMAADGFTKMSRVVFPTQTEADGLGCDWHPGPNVNAKMATQLTTELKTKLGW